MPYTTNEDENTNLKLSINKKVDEHGEREFLAYKLINIIETKRKMQWSQMDIYLNLFHILEKGYELTDKQKDIINNTYSILCSNEKNKNLISEIYESRKKEIVEEEKTFIYNGELCSAPPDDE